MQGSVYLGVTFGEESFDITVLVCCIINAHVVWL